MDVLGSGGGPVASAALTADEAGAKLQACLRLECEADGGAVGDGARCMAIHHHHPLVARGGTRQAAMHFGVRAGGVDPHGTRRRCVGPEVFPVLGDLPTSCSFR